MNLSAYMKTLFKQMSGFTEKKLWAVWSQGIDFKGLHKSVLSLTDCKLLRIDVSLYESQQEKAKVFKLFADDITWWHDYMSFYRKIRLK